MAAEGDVLRDKRLDRRLRRDGFVKAPLLDPAVAEDLRAGFGELRGWEGSGFEPDLTSPDRSYRRAADELLSRALDDVVRAMFVDREPFLRSFLCKHPGAESELYLHRDWMYVDERAGGRTHVAWVALEDITADNGQLRVVRGSHRLPSLTRGTELGDPWMRHEQVLRDRLLAVPVRAGECIVFDNALVHCSYPNFSARPRLAAAVAVHHRRDPLVHFRRHDDDRAARYEVDREFFLAQTPVGLMQEAPPAEPAELVATGGTDLEAAALARALDRSPLARLDRLRHGRTPAR